MERLNVLKKLILSHNSIQRNHIRFQTRWLSIQTSKKESEKANVDDADQPVKFTTSKAASELNDDFIGHGQLPRGPWYQPVSLFLSLGVAVIYTVTRKENAIDERLQYVHDILVANDTEGRE